MYCLTFKDFANDPKPKVFYYHNYSNAVTMQRAMLVNEINNLIVYYTNEEAFDIEDFYGDIYIEELQKLLKILIKLIFRGVSEEYQITIDINVINFEDKPFI